MAGGAGAGAGKEDQEGESGPPTCTNTQTALTSQLLSPTGVAVAGSCHSPPDRRMMNDELKETIDQLANSLQTVTLLATRLRRDLAESGQQARDLETAADTAIRAVKRLQPPDKRDH